MNPKIQNKFLSHKFSLLGLLVLSFFLIVTAFAIKNKRSSFFTRATSVSGSPGTTLISFDNSYIFASPIEAAANGTAVIRATVFLLDDQGLGVPGQRVQLRSSGPVTVSQTQSITDSLGKAIFDLTASTVGDYTLTVEVAGAVLSQTVTVSFR